ncbi:MAG: NAD(P)/FAD-dependent oxidoreductase [Caldiserica bacterium]|jgi:glycerol-3-phosphate dehydrogenase|nr:NAD(P)/FAD-dependent oxidoreductase [Caldisericota bacterium]MDH7561853.1 NAD(P)/FAD-dependent oxidoreductase [Caldisericota bacterium]
MKKYDVIIIGAGIIGCMVARFLSRYKLDILLIEKEADVCMGATAANTAIIHAGYDPVPGSLKAEMNVKGNKMWDTLAGELNIPFERRGDYVVAIGEEELPKLEELMKQGIQNGVPGLLLLSGDEVRRREPNINPKVSGALWASTGGIADPFAAAVAAAENAVMNGVTIMFETAFQDFIMDNNRVVGIKTSRGDFASRWVINCAGLYSDEVMHKAGIRPEFKITPRKGEYYVFDRAEITINNVLFPVPTPVTKGILVTTTIHGNTIIGPNAKDIQDKEDRSVTREGLEEVWQGALKLVPKLELKHVIAVFAGLRAGGNAPSPNPNIKYNHDYIIEIPSEVKGLVNLGGIESPGLVSSPAIATRVVELLKDAGEKLEEKKDWDPIRPARPRFRDLSKEEQRILVQNDPRYGRIVCRCESVTEGEIVAEIHAPVPARTYDAIKRRTWLGTGRCQGGFDTPRVVEILARELGVSPVEITKKGPGSEFLKRRTKDVA